MDEIAAAIRPAVREESESQLARFDKAVAGENLPTRGFGPFGGGQTKPIKPFAKVRTESVLEQLAGKSQGLVQGDGGFPGGGPGRPGGPGGSGLGMMFSRPLLRSLKGDQLSTVTEVEFRRGFTRLFEAWNSDKSGRLTLAQLRAGIDQDLAPSHEEFPPFGDGPAEGGERPSHGPGQALNPPRPR